LIYTSAGTDKFFDPLLGSFTPLGGSAPVSGKPYYCALYKGSGPHTLDAKSWCTLHSGADGTAFAGNPRNTEVVFDFLSTATPNALADNDLVDIAIALKNPDHKENFDIKIRTQTYDATNKLWTVVS
jgi:hypothetical protein